MPSDADKWNAIHGRDPGRAERTPDAFVLEALAELGPGSGRRALDLAAGTGRHALALAERGFETHAWDVSDVGLAILAERARNRGLEVTTRTIDLARGPLPAERFDVVVVVDFLDRALFARLYELVAPGGQAIVATFSEDWPEAHPSARFRLARGELTRGLPGLAALRADERGGRAGLLATRS